MEGLPPAIQNVMHKWLDPKTEDEVWKINQDDEEEVEEEMQQSVALRLTPMEVWGK